MKGGKAPGPDGLSIDTYQIFKNKLLSPHVFVESFNSGKLPPSMCNALIILILNPGKPETNCDSYD